MATDDELLPEGNGRLLFMDDSGNPLKFTMVRVPGRDRIRDIIEGNGGEVVTCAPPNELFMRLGLPGYEPSEPGMYSSEYVVDSVKEGMLLERDNYELPWKGKKIGRTPFTQQDKIILRDKLKKAGKDLGGNAIYKDLAKTFPHHTWQGWRDHAVKHILPTLHAERKIDMRAGIRPDGASAAQSSNETPVLPVNNASTTSKSTGRRTQEFSPFETELLQELMRISKEAQHEAIYDILSEKHPGHAKSDWKRYARDVVLPGLDEEKAMLDANSSESSTPGRKRMRGTRAEFTKHDRMLMREEARKRWNLGGLKGNTLWKEFALKHPQHQWDSWRGHFNKKIYPVMEEAKELLDKAIRRMLVRSAEENRAGADDRESVDDEQSADEAAPNLEQEQLPQRSQEINQAVDDEGGSIPWMTQPQNVRMNVDSEGEDEEAPQWKTQAPEGFQSDTPAEEEETEYAVPESKIPQSDSRVTSQPRNDNSDNPFFTQARTPQGRLESHAESPNTAPSQRAVRSGSSKSRSNRRRTVSGGQQSSPERSHQRGVQMVGTTEEELESLLEQQARLAQAAAEEARHSSSDEEDEQEREEEAVGEPPQTIDDGEEHVGAEQAEASDQEPESQYLTAPDAIDSIDEAPPHTGLDPIATSAIAVEVTSATNRRSTAEQKEHFFDWFDALCDDYDSRGFSKKQCLRALNMASGNFSTARKLLDVNFDVSNLGRTRRQNIFTEDDDAVLLGSDAKARAELRAEKGRVSARRRMEYLNAWALLHSAAHGKEAC